MIIIQRHRKSRFLIFIAHFKSGSLLKKITDNISVALTGSQHQRCLLPSLGSIYIASVLAKKPKSLQLSFPGGSNQRKAPNFCTLLLQQIHTFYFSILGLTV